MTENEYTNIYNLVSKANKRLANLEKFSGKDVSWAGARLQSMIDNGKTKGWKNNRINIDKTMNDYDLRRIESATNLFLKNKTSTITGVKKAIEKTKNSLGYNFNVTKDEAERLYNLLSDDSFKYIKENSSATSSDIWYVITEAKENRFTNKRFIDRMYDIMDVIPDQETKDVLNSLYMKEVLGVD